MSAPFLAVWHNGALGRDEAIAISPANRGLTLGDGLFETIAVFNGIAVWLDDHLDRLMGGAAVIGLDIARQDVAGGVTQCLAQAGRVRGILRITVTRGAGGRGLAASAMAATLLVTLAPWTGGMLFREATLITARVRRNEHSPVSLIKSLSYLDNILAAREAAEAGADDALMLNTAGRAACSTIANVFLIEDGGLVTPPPSEGVLAGIARRKVMDAARELGLNLEEAPLAVQRVSSAQGIFLTNSLRLMRPVTSLDGDAISSTAVAHLAAIFDRLCHAVARDCGIDPRNIDKA
ncbi:aminotransferase class IV [soil metagenome]